MLVLRVFLRSLKEEEIGSPAGEVFFSDKDLMYIVTVYLNPWVFPDMLLRD